MGQNQTESYGSCIIACFAVGQAWELIESECERRYDSDLWLCKLNSLYLIDIDSESK